MSTTPVSYTHLGTQYEELNLIQPKFTEQFLGTEEDTQYHLSFAGLDDAPVKVELLDAEGAWQEKAEDTDYTVCLLYTSRCV